MGRRDDEVNALMPGFKGPPGFDNVPTLERLNTPTLWLLGHSLSPQVWDDIARWIQPFSNE